MIGKVFTGVKRFILWDYPRASWQYDVMVILILAFVFLTPREWFRDQPRIPRASRIARVQTAEGTEVFWMEPELLSHLPETERAKRAEQLIVDEAGVRQPVRLEPVYGPEAELKGYLAFTERQR